MVKINSRCFIVDVNGVQYVVKYGKIDEFIEAGRYIKAGWSIDAGESIKAGGYIEAGGSSGIVAGKQIGRAHV